MSNEFRKRVFVSSPLSADTQLDMEINQVKAVSHCLFLSDLGFAPYAPHIICTQWLNDKVPQERCAGIDIGLSFLSVCSINFAFLHHNRWTTGMIQEREACFKLGIPVFVFRQAHNSHQEGPYKILLQDDVFIRGEKIDIRTLL